MCSSESGEAAHIAAKHVNPFLVRRADETTRDARLAKVDAQGHRVAGFAPMVSLGALDLVRLEDHVLSRSV